MPISAFALTVGGIAIAWIRNRRARRWLAAVLLVWFAGALLADGASGALLPPAAWVVLAILFARFAPLPRSRLAWLVIAVPATILGGITMLLSAALTFVPPPPATGRYGVGSFQWVLRDTARGEQRTQDPDDARELLVEIWYPTEAPPRDAAERAQWDAGLAEFRVPYSHPAVAQAIGAGYALPGLAPMFAREVGRLAKPGARGVPIAPGSGAFPVLVFSPGYGVHIDYYAGMLADIASHGYVVLAVNPSHEVAVTALPDGRIITGHDKTRQDEPGPSRADASRIEKATLAAYMAMPELMAMKEPRRRARYFELRQQRAAAETFLTRSIDDRAADIGFVLDRLAAQQSDGPPNLLSGRIDLSRVGVFGMSLGGPTSGQFCLTDPRCKAGLNYDGEIWGAQLSAMDTRIPYMWITGAHDGQDKAMMLGVEYLFRSASAPVDFVEIDHMNHMDFSDIPFLSPLAGYVGRPLEALRHGRSAILSGRRRSIDYTVAFFDHWLKGQDPALLRSPGATGISHRRRNNDQATDMGDKGFVRSAWQRAESRGSGIG